MFDFLLPFFLIMLDYFKDICMSSSCGVIICLWFSVSGTLYRAVIVPSRTFCIVCDSPLNWSLQWIHLLLLVAQYLKVTLKWKAFFLIAFLLFQIELFKKFPSGFADVDFIFSRLALVSQRLRSLFYSTIIFYINDNIVLEISTINSVFGWSLRFKF